MAPKKRARLKAGDDEGESYSWDSPAAPQRAGSYTWDEEGSEHEALDDERLTDEQCGKVMLDLLLKLKEQGRLFATDVCLLAYWAERAGAKGLMGAGYPPIKKLASTTITWILYRGET